MRFNFFWLIICTFFIPFQCYCEEQNIIKIAMRQNLSVYGYEEPSWPNNDTRFKDFLAFVVDLEQNLQEHTKRRTCFLMLNRFFQKQNDKKDIVAIDGISFKDLNIFSGQTDELHYLAKILDRTCSIFGRIWLYGMLALPTFNKEEFLKKQAIVKELVDNTELRNALQKELVRLESVENNVLSFWLNDPLRNATNRKFFKLSIEQINNYSNKNETFLNIRSLFDHHQRAILVVATVLAATLLPVYNKHVLSDSITKLSERLFSAGGPLFGLLQSFSDQKYFVGGLAVLSGLYCSLSAKESVEWAYDNVVLEKVLHEKMKNIAIAIDSLRNINELLYSNEKFRLLLNESNSL